MRPDPQLADAGSSGEILIAGIRLLIFVVVAYATLTLYLQAPYARRGQVLLGSAALALLEALLVYSAARRNWGKSWIGFASSLVDVTMVSGCLRLVQAYGVPQAGELLVFPAYFLAIGSTSLRYDSRICLVTGALMLAQYGALALSGAAPGASWIEPVGKLLLLGTAAVLATAIVLRSRESRSLSILDALTGLKNRGYFDERLREEADRAARAHKPLTVVMIDIDHFKEFNDSHGHGGGDEALRVLSRVLRACYRRTDIVARYGGEEMALILPGMQPEDAVRRAERVCKKVAETPIPLTPKAGAPTLTISLGVATWPEDGATIEEVLQSADRRLYAAKHAGRNRVVGRMHEAAPPRSEPALAGPVG